MSIFLLYQRISKMSRGRNKTFNQMYANENDEVNTSIYPYYRTIPIQEISEKQQKMLEKFRVVPFKREALSTSEESVEDTRSTPYEEQTVIPAMPVTPAYHNPQGYENLPVFNMVKVENSNIYRVDMSQYEQKCSEDLKNLETRLAELEQEIKDKSYLIERQNKAIETNEKTFQEQTNRMNSINLCIENNNNYIQQQISVYNHNIAVLHSQCVQYNANNNEIINQQQNLSTQYNQINEYQAQIEQLELQLQDYQQQLSYHGTMLNAFNTLIQNPTYFTQLMAAASAASFTPGIITEVNDVQGETNTT